MKNRIIICGILLVLIIVISLSFIKKADDEVGDDVMYIKINDKVLEVELVDNSSAKEFLEKLNKEDVIVDMHDYGNMEKVGKLNFDISRSDKNTKVDYGDVILYLGNNITIYYDKNEWNFTKLGHIKDVSKEELRNILGEGNVTVTFSIKK